MRTELHTPNVVTGGPSLRPARAPLDRRDEQRLLAIDPESELVRSGTIRDLPQLLEPGDVLVLNDAATLPASLWAETADGDRVELRLAGRDGDGFACVILGAGDWRRPTEARGPAPAVEPGSKLFVFDPMRSERAALHAAVRSVEHDETGRPRWLRIAFEESGSALVDALYRAGRPIQYAHVERPVDVWDVQNVFVGRPWAFEMPSAARGLSWEILSGLRRRDVEVRALTHAAGISSTGSALGDRRLPLAERYELPRETVGAIAAARERGGRVIAAGTTVVRALEAAASGGELCAGSGSAELVLGPESVLRVVDGVLSGLHEFGSTHFQLLAAFAPVDVLHSALCLAASLGYRQHEFGDAWLILPPRGIRRAA